ncbi:hypothetical protein EDD17DRAFT_1829690 [Pisolithus thermaeus]|nr:hypothetical protein EV401DRAFT_2053330 [Pisolithus croceorrhizus]KAI6168246.1 hypothetical protein EDD17DRAFT_1829690 [Pisolithus thermaeus]
MMMVLQPITAVYQYIVTPVASLAWFGLKTSTLDLLATIQLCLALRQIRESLKCKHLKCASSKQSEGAITAVESRSFVMDALTTLVVVHGGEAMICPYILVPALFMLSSTTPLLCIITQALVESIPAPIMPIPSFNTEFPLLIFDMCNHAFLLFSIVPAIVLSSPIVEASGSPWTLLLSSLIINGGFFLVNLFSLHHPTAVAVWTMTNLWCVLLPFWAGVHAVLIGLLRSLVDGDGLAKLKPVDAEMARAVCALILTGLFIT